MPSSMGSKSGSLLVLTNHVYAKKEDGLFYPGSIESKHNENYVVVFADNTKEMLPEEYITWLAFCGLPPSSWPKNPVIQPTIAGASEKEFDGSFVKYYDDTTGQKPASLTLLKEEDVEKCSTETELTSQSSSRKCYHPRKLRLPSNSDEASEEDIQDHDLKLMRSSVLRINTKALSTTGSESNNILDRSGLQLDDSSRDLVPASPFQPTPKYKKMKRPNFRSMLLPGPGDKVFEMARCSCGTLGMPKFPTKYCNHEEEEIETENIEYYSRPTYPSPYNPHRPYQNMEWYAPSHFNQPSPTSPITPSTLISPMEHDPQQGMRTTFWPRHVHEGLAPRFDLPLFGHHDPYGGLRVVRDEWKETVNGMGPGKKRRKDGLKKCRKVYGVYNRNLWCTQCKWKKACTRFRA